MPSVLAPNSPTAHLPEVLNPPTHSSVRPNFADNALLAGVDPKVVQTICGRLEVVRYPPDQVIFAEFDAGE